MNWNKLFATHILERGYDYYCGNAVENLDVSDDIIRADVMGAEIMIWVNGQSGIWRC